MNGILLYNETRKVKISLQMAEHVRERINGSLALHIVSEMGHIETPLINNEIYLISKSYNEQEINNPTD